MIPLTLETNDDFMLNIKIRKLFVLPITTLYSIFKVCGVKFNDVRY